MPVKVTKDNRVIRTGQAYTTFRADLHRRQNLRCANCGRTTSLTVDLEHDFSFHVDHKNGRGMGGSRRDDTFESCQGLCGRCHRDKHGQR